jgi:hypothetical protein
MRIEKYHCYSPLLELVKDSVKRYKLVKSNSFNYVFFHFVLIPTITIKLFKIESRFDLNIWFESMFFTFNIFITNSLPINEDELPF